MTPADERALYDADRQAWAVQAAGRWRGLIERGDDRNLLHLWSIACDDLRRELLRQHAGLLLPRWAAVLGAADPQRKALLWRQAGDELRQALRVYAATQPAPAGQGDAP